MFLQYILKEDTDSLISQFFYQQDSNPVKNDWTLTCREDLKNLNIKLSFQEIGSLSKEKFKDIVKKAVSDKTFEYLKGEKDKLSKFRILCTTSLAYRNIYFQTKPVVEWQSSSLMQEVECLMLSAIIRIDIRNISVQLAVVLSILSNISLYVKSWRTLQ